MLREEEERYQVETRISRLFWMSLALVPLWLSKQKVSWSSAPWTQSVPVVKTWRGRRKRKGYPQGRWNTVGRKRPHHVSDRLFLCLILLSCPVSHHVLCSSFPPLLFRVFPFLTLLLHHASPCTWAHIPLLGHQRRDGYQPHSPLQRGQCFTR